MTSRAVHLADQGHQVHLDSARQEQSSSVNVCNWVLNLASIRSIIGT
jgi:hypothetical protein